MRTLGALVVITAVFTAFLPASEASAKGKPKLEASKHRKVKKGVGNCIFSTAELPFGKEGAYKDVKTTFRTGDTVYARCYFGKQLQAFGKKGKLMNELRDERTYRISLAVGAKPKSKRARRMKSKKKSAGATLPTTIIRVKQDGEEEWDQRDFNLDPASKRCLFKSHLGTTGCLDFDRAAQELATFTDDTGPFTAELCLSMYVEYANKQTGQSGSSVVEAVRITDPITAGCFDWTTTVAPPPPPPEPAPPKSP